MSAGRIVVVTDSTHAVLATLHTLLGLDALRLVVHLESSLPAPSPSALVHSLLSRRAAGAPAFSLTPYARTQSSEDWSEGQVLQFVAPSDLRLSAPTTSSVAAGQGGLALAPFPASVAAAGAAQKALASSAWDELCGALPALHSVILERDEICEDGWLLTSASGDTATIPVAWHFTDFIETNWDDVPHEPGDDQMEETEMFATVVRMIHRRFGLEPSLPVTSAAAQAVWFEHMQHLLRSITGTTHGLRFVLPSSAAS